MIGSLKKNLWRAHRWLARSPKVVEVALLVRNQAECVINQHLSPPIESSANGEELLIKQLGKHIHSFVDVGANVGDWSELAIRHSQPGCVGNLYEPGIAAHDLLQQKFRRNSNIKIHKIALSDQVGQAEFYEEAAAGQMSSLLQPRGQDITPIMVRVSTLVEQFSAQKWPSIDYVKIDAEGYDLKIIQGASRLFLECRMHYVQFEYNSFWRDNGSLLQDAMAIFSESKYAVFRICPNGLIRHRFEQFGEYYLYSNFLAVAPSRIESVTPILLN